MASPPSLDEHQLQNMLQAAVQAVHWTYSLFWKLCPQQGMLVWGDGYYNGAIKTRKTVYPVEVSTEEASLERSEQLRELYESLSAGDSNHPTRRPSAALSPEDLTESEWFYLMCVSFSFPLGVGLPGNAYVKRRHMWLAGANDADSKFFTRAILAKSARVQTVVCIPLLDGVVELGTTDRIEENVKLIQCVKRYFRDYNPATQPPKPALSNHSTSNLLLCLQDTVCNPKTPVSNNDDDYNNYDDHSSEKSEDDDDNSGYNIIGEGDGLLNANTEMVQTPPLRSNNIGGEIGEELDMSESIGVGSPEDVSTNLDSDFDLLKVCPLDTFKPGSKWENIQDTLHTPLTGVFPSEELHHGEDIHYSETVTTILHSSRGRDSDASSAVYPTFSSSSAFTICTTSTTPPRSHHHHRHVTNKTSQCLLKNILFTVPYLHTKSHSLPRLKKSTSQEELSANHVLAERRRREKLNERFIVLRSLVPFVTKMDKASILGDTIEYVKQLRKKIQDLEARHADDHVTSVHDQRLRSTGETRRTKRKKTEMPQQTAVEVSIIESDGLVEMKCPYKEGLLLDVMIKLREFGMEITAVHSSSDNGDLVAELRAKVKEKCEGRKPSIMEVKRAIKHMII